MEKQSTNFLILIFIVVCVYSDQAKAIKCRSEEGLSDDEVRSMVRSCMSKVGGGFQNEYENDNQDKSRRNNNQHHQNGQNQNNQNQNNQNEYHYRGNNSRYKRDRFNENSNSTENDKNCILHCFFQEMKMTNGEEFPEKHKVIHGFTKDMRNPELKEFYTDSIQECFHLIEMNRKSEKCEFSKKLMDCLNERARSNCEDWQNQTLPF